MRPVLFVLAGVNGAGKSSVGGHVLAEEGGAWFNPDTFARELVALGYAQTEANSIAWHEGVRRLDEARALGHNYAFETTLGGNTVPAKIREASTTHDVLIWYCGLDSPERHIARVEARVESGGHSIPEQKIRERWVDSVKNLIGLLPVAARVKVYDNSREAMPGAPVPDPVLVADYQHGRLAHPHSADQLAATPDWAKPIVQAMMELGDRE